MYTEMIMENVLKKRRKVVVQRGAEAQVRESKSRVQGGAEHSCMKINHPTQ